MATINVNEIVSKASEIAKEMNENIFFSVRGSIIEGCRNRKTSEEFEYNAKKQFSIFDNTANEVATSIIENAIEELSNDSKVTVEFEEVEDEETTSDMSFSHDKSYFLRFTANASADMKRGTSLFKTGSMDSAIALSGLCGFQVDFSGMNKKQIENAVSQYATNFPHYSKNAQAVIFEGRFIEKNANSEGDVFQPLHIEGIVKF
jgi:hypothetical protein